MWFDDVRRIGEAANPGPGCLDEADADVWTELDEHLGGCIDDVGAGTLPDFDEDFAGAVHAAGGDALTDVTYIASRKFQGAKRGFVLTTGVHGTGYYLDRLQTDPSDHRRVISLADALPVVRDVVDAQQTRGSLITMVGDSTGSSYAAVGDSRRARHRRREGRRIKCKAVDVGPLVVPSFCTLGDAPVAKRGVWSLDTVNANAWPGARRILERSSAEVALIQETRIDDVELCRQTEQAARGYGWNVSMSSAHRTAANSTPGGVAVATRRGIGMANSAAAHIPDLYQYRLTCGWVVGALRGGFHAVSIWPWPSEAMSERNCNLLQAAAELVLSLRGPRIIGGDWNLNPSQLLDAGRLSGPYGFDVDVPNQTFQTPSRLAVQWPDACSSSATFSPPWPSPRRIVVWQCLAAPIWPAAQCVCCWCWTCIL